MSDVKDYGVTKDGKPKGKPGPKAKAKATPPRWDPDLRDTIIKEAVEEAGPTTFVEDRLHYFLIAFNASQVDINGNIVKSWNGSIRYGWTGQQYVNESRLAEARAVLFKDDPAFRAGRLQVVPVGVSYMGFMTPELARS